MNPPCYYFENQFTRYEADFLKASSDRRSFAAGEFLSPPSSAFHTCYYFLSGLVRCYAIADTGGQSPILQFYGPGSMAPCYGQAHDFTVEPYLIIQAISPVEALAIPIPVFGKMLTENPDLARDVLSFQIHQKNNVIVRLLQISSVTSYQIVCNMLYLLCEQDTRLSHGHALALSQESLADLCCLSRMQITRVLRKLREEGIVETKRKALLVKDINALREHCSSLVDRTPQ
ncbi:MAG: Crp/Fnr family transcriptional regulator [Lachnospiraceae bacterium]|nr:Crp/Fnr family transcriptional regulator [Lachnospiraceae bacterium]